MSRAWARSSALRPPHVPATLGSVKTGILYDLVTVKMLSHYQ